MKDMKLESNDYANSREHCKDLISGIEDFIVWKRKKEKNNQYLQRLSTDQLTGLKTLSYVKYAYSLVKKRIEKGKDVSVLFLDIDNIKYVNDNLSYNEANTLIQHSGKILNQTLFERTIDILSGQTRTEGRVKTGKGLIKDIAARYHEKWGDELLIVLYGTGREGADSVAKRIINYTKRDSLFIDHQCGISIGGSSRNGCSNLDYLIKNAEIALKHCKKHSKGGYVHFDDLPAGSFNLVEQSANI